MGFDFTENFEKMMEEKKLDTILILGHMIPDGDATGSVMGLAHYLHTVYPHYRVVPYLADDMFKGPRKLAEKDKIFNPFNMPDKKSLGRYGVIVCDTATRDRIAGKELYDNGADSIVIDHHAANEGYGSVNNTYISEACAQNIFYLLDWERWDACMTEAEKLHPNALDYIYLGIVQDTSGFERASVPTMEAASALLKKGVDHKEIIKTMHNTSLHDLYKRAELLKMVQRAEDGKVAYIYVDQAVKEAYGIGYEDIYPMCTLLRECEDIELGFTMFERTPGNWRCSFRSDGKWINCNKLLSFFNGGGHAGAAGLSKKTDKPEKLLSDILAQIAAMRKEA